MTWLAKIVFGALNQRMSFGSPLSPILAGILLGADLRLPLIAGILGSGYLLALVLLVFLRRERE